jgi:hypothetical protein
MLLYYPRPHVTIFEITLFHDLQESDMKIELTKVQANQAMSRETFCFSANLIVDGVARGVVENHGNGGPHRYSDRNVEDEIDAYAATQPRRTYPALCGEETYSLPESTELLVNDQVMRHTEGKRLRKLLASKFIFVTQKGHVVSLKATPEQIAGALKMRAQDLVAHYGKLLAKSSPDDLPIASLNHAPFE